MTGYVVESSFFYSGFEGLAANFKALRTSPSPPAPVFAPFQKGGPDEGVCVCLALRRREIFCPERESERAKKDLTLWSQQQSHQEAASQGPPSLSNTFVGSGRRGNWTGGGPPTTGKVILKKALYVALVGERVGAKLAKLRVS